MQAHNYPKRYDPAVAARKEKNAAIFRETMKCINQGDTRLLPVHGFRLIFPICLLVASVSSMNCRLLHLRQWTEVQG